MKLGMLYGSKSGTRLMVRLEKLVQCIGCRISEELLLLLDVFFVWMEQPLRIDSG